MIRHPLALAFWCAALGGTLLYALAAERMLRAIVDWRPMDDALQSTYREERYPAGALLGRWAAGCLTAAAFVGAVGIAVAWPRVIPGAMCGTGVLQAMAGNGGGALGLWTAALLVLYGWRVLDRFNELRPESVLTPVCGRVFLLAAPFLALALESSWRSLAGIEAAPVVSCCAANYDRVLFHLPAAAEYFGPESAGTRASLLVGGTVILAAFGYRRRPGRVPAALLAVLVGVWTVMATAALKFGWSSVFFEVLSHPCLWCLFLPEHYGVGFPLLGSLAVGAAQALALILSDGVARRHPSLALSATAAGRRSALWIAAAAAAFIVMVSVPAVVWRLQSGTGITGTP